MGSSFHCLHHSEAFLTISRHLIAAHASNLSSVLSHFDCFFSKTVKIFKKYEESARLSTVGDSAGISEEEKRN